MSGNGRRPSEREIIYSGVLGGLSIAQIDELLMEVGARTLGPGSYAMLKGCLLREHGQWNWYRSKQLNERIPGVDLSSEAGR